MSYNALETEDRIQYMKNLVALGQIVNPKPSEEERRVLREKYLQARIK